jgi:hypothetical protein
LRPLTPASRWDHRARSVDSSHSASCTI